MSEIVAEVKRNILGPLTVGFYLSAGFFTLISLTIMTYYRSLKRDKTSPNTPVHFSWQFMLWDNTKKIVVGMLIMFVLFRFTSEFLNSPLSMKMALGIGFLMSLGLEPLIEGLMRKYESICNALSMPREKYMEKLVTKAADELENVTHDGPKI